MNELYDVIVVGAGPAGLTAAIYASRANLKTLVFEAEVNGGKLSKTHMVENYPGIGSISGLELATQLSEHGQKFGATMTSGTVEKIIENDDCKTVLLTNGQEYHTKTIVVATGTRERLLDVPHAKEFTGRGISYCAVCDGFFYRNKKVAVIGGGNSALEEALYLASLASEVTIIIRRDVFRAEASVVDKVRSNEKIKIVTRHVPDQLVIEEDRIKGLMIRNVDTDETQVIECNGIFPYIGADPCTSFLDPSILDPSGYMIVNPDMSTSIKGIYGAGDCIVKDLRQIVTACSDGAIAANSITKYLEK